VSTAVPSSKTIQTQQRREGAGKEEGCRKTPLARDHASKGERDSASVVRPSSMLGGDENQSWKEALLMVVGGEERFGSRTSSLVGVGGCGRGGKNYGLTLSPRRDCHRTCRRERRRWVGS